jgi:hypothetical protein
MKDLLFWRIHYLAPFKARTQRFDVAFHFISLESLDEPLWIDPNGELQISQPSLQSENQLVFCKLLTTRLLQMFLE